MQRVAHVGLSSFIVFKRRMGKQRDNTMGRQSTFPLGPAGRRSRSTVGRVPGSQQSQRPWRAVHTVTTPALLQSCGTVQAYTQPCPFLPTEQTL